jgi:hypothetical protein
MDPETTKRMAQVMDPEEFKRLLNQFGREALAKAEARGRTAAIRDVLKIILRARIPATPKEWLLNQCRNLTTPPL